MARVQRGSQHLSALTVRSEVSTLAFRLQKEASQTSVCRLLTRPSLPWERSETLSSVRKYFLLLRLPSASEDLFYTNRKHRHEENSLTRVLQAGHITIQGHPHHDVDGPPACMQSFILTSIHVQGRTAAPSDSTRRKCQLTQISKIGSSQFCIQCRHVLYFSETLLYTYVFPRVQASGDMERSVREYVVARPCLFPRMFVAERFVSSRPTPQESTCLRHHFQISGFHLQIEIVEAKAPAETSSLFPLPVPPLTAVRYKKHGLNYSETFSRLSYISAKAFCRELSVFSRVSLLQHRGRPCPL
ncbi:hypothetical protein TGMAS_415840 [Toxoplasma gondii MAS]|uniref:Uncharacterized protein n=1 Tax=Toxoplasma gondii MAS TaxID=943118 RepID=A0A086Q3Q9_TOXGO|nr:hypothetical protein TGMAS_415840 [Toxoplasma gondii MAS]